MDMGQCTLIKTSDNLYYWHFDYRLSDDSGGIFCESILYQTEKEALNALVSVMHWEIAEVNDYETLL